MKFGTHYDKVKAPVKAYREPSAVSSSGYVTPEALIKGMVVAGQHFSMAKEALYDTEQGTPVSLDVPLDPTRELGYSELDALDDMHRMQEKLRTATDRYNAQVKEAKRIAEAKRLLEGSSPVGIADASIPAVVPAKEVK